MPDAIRFDSAILTVKDGTRIKMGPGRMFLSSPIVGDIELQDGEGQLDKGSGVRLDRPPAWQRICPQCRAVLPEPKPTPQRFIDLSEE